MKPWQKRREKQKLKNRTNVVCLECGASFTILKSLVKYGGAKYCSRVCYDTARSKQSKSLLGYIDGYPVYEGSRRYAFISLGARGQYRVALQRYLMEKSMGRQLLPGEVVHHKNGLPYDNRLENLEVVSHSEHRLRHEELRLIALGGVPGKDRVCAVCKTAKPVENFGYSNRLYMNRLNVCKTCITERNHKAHLVRKAKLGIPDRGVRIRERNAKLRVGNIKAAEEAVNA